MTRSELIAALAAAYPQLSKEQVDVAVRTILSTMAETLAGGGRIEVRGFGSFAVHLRPERIARNPKTGERVAVPPKWVPHFKAGKQLRERVDRGVSAEELDSS